VFYAQFAGSVDKTHRIQACFRLVICLDVCKDSLIGKGEMLQTEGGNKMATIEKIHSHSWRLVRGLNKDGQIQWECISCKERG
jgi:hypothetical protein